MAENQSGSRVNIAQLILVPSLITLAVTILRLVGELQHWSKPLFNPSPGGGLAVVGISWLPFIFGPYFAIKLAGAGQGPKSRGKAIGFAVLGLAVLILGGFVVFAPKLVFPGKVAVGYLIMAAAAVLQLNPWPALGKALLAYGYAARIPVAIVMYLAILGSWGTHYDAFGPADKGAMDFWPKYAALGLEPQLIFWVVFTVIIGTLFGTIAAAIARRSKPATHAAT
jgi:hypothetical protein